ncbi:hypothetical protein YC2023_094992 [Brassica napus]
MIEEELGFAKSALKQTIGLLPENALVGFVSFGTQAHVHELGFSEMSKVFVFKGNKEVSKDQVLDQLGLSSRRAPTSGFPKRAQNGFQSAAGVNRFLLHASDCEYTLDLPGHHPQRCTGVVLSVAAGLLGACFPGTGARIVALVGGPCTEGPGMVRAWIL